MDVGVHLPIASLEDERIGGKELRAYVRTAAELGFVSVSANDHLIWRKPWLDGPTALTSVLEQAGAMTLMTSVTLPAIRHPVVVAKWLATLACLTDGRVLAGLGPGSSEADYRAAGVPFAERWGRFDAALRVVRALVRGEQAPASAWYPDVGAVRLEPLPERAPEVWFGSWGSDARLRATAEVADGWMCSGYNITPKGYVEARRRLDGHLAACGRDPSVFPDMVATLWTYVTPDPAEADRVIRQVLAPILGREPVELAARLPVGTPDHCIALLRAYRDAGAGQVLLWPVRDPIRQLEVFQAEVRPHLDV